jgi:hypothetical protein
LTKSLDVWLGVASLLNVNSTVRMLTLANPTRLRMGIVENIEASLKRKTERELSMVYQKRCVICRNHPINGEKYPAMEGSDRCYYHSNRWYYPWYGYPTLDYKMEVRLFLEVDKLHVDMPTIAVVNETPLHELDEKFYVGDASSWRRSAVLTTDKVHVVSHHYGNSGATLHKCTPEFHEQHYRTEPNSCLHAKGKVCTCQHCHTHHHGELRELS